MEWEVMNCTSWLITEQIPLVLLMQDSAFHSSAWSITSGSGTCRRGTCWSGRAQFCERPSIQWVAYKQGKGRSSVCSSMVWVSTGLHFHSANVEEAEAAGTKRWNSATLTWPSQRQVPVAELNMLNYFCSHQEQCTPPKDDSSGLS